MQCGCRRRFGFSPNPYYQGKTINCNGRTMVGQVNIDHSSVMLTVPFPGGYLVISLT